MQSNGRRPAPATDPGDRLPPQSLEAERGVLGSILLDNSALLDVAPLLEPGDFYRDAHQVAYRVIRELYDAGVPVDTLLLAEELQRRGQYERLGGDDFIASLIDSVPHAANAVHYAVIAREKATLRRVIAAAHAMLRDSYDDSLPADDVLGRSEAALFAAADHAGSGGGARPASEFLAASRRRYEARLAGERGGLTTGLDPLDEYLDGLHGGGLYVLAGRPGHGKTSLALNIADHAAFARGVPALFASLEMRGEELLDKLVVAHARVDGHRYRAARGLSADEMAAIDRAFADLDGGALQLWIDDTGGLSIDRIRSEARRRRRRDRIGLVVIDYLQLVDPGPSVSRGANRDEKVGHVTGRLKDMAKELNVPVLLLCQLNRDVEKREGHTPRLSDLRESGNIEQDADVVMFLGRPELHKKGDRAGEADLVIAKNRHGRVGTIPLVFIAQHGRLVPLYQPDPEF